jgi:hypothetical protein
VTATSTIRGAGAGRARASRAARLVAPDNFGDVFFEWASTVMQDSVIAASGTQRLEPVHPGFVPFGITKPILVVP